MWITVGGKYTQLLTAKFVSICVPLGYVVCAVVTYQSYKSVGSVKYVVHSRVGTLLQYRYVSQPVYIGTMMVFATSYGGGEGAGGVVRTAHGTACSDKHIVLYMRYVRARVCLSCVCVCVYMCWL